MAKRTIRTGIGSYQRPDGIWTHGLQGDEVDVHADDIERFDRVEAEALGLRDEPATEQPAPKAVRTAKPKG